MYQLKSWVFLSTPNEDGKTWRIHGNVYGNRPGFKDGQLIHTSDVVDIEILSDSLRVHTDSGSIYDCAFADSEEEEFLFLDDSSLFSEHVSLKDVKARIISYQKQCAEQEGRKLRHAISENTTSLVMIFSDSMNAAYYPRCLLLESQEKVKRIRPLIHVGMFQDSVLIQSHNGNGKIDIRYLIYQDHLESYKWQCLPEISVYALSNGKRSVQFNTPYGKFLIQPDGKPVCVSNQDKTGDNG